MRLQTSNGTGAFSPNEDRNSQAVGFGTNSKVKFFYGTDVLWTLRDPITQGEPVQGLLSCTQPLTFSAQLVDVPTVPTTFAGATTPNPDGSSPRENEASEVAFIAPRPGVYEAKVMVANGSVRLNAPGATPQTVSGQESFFIIVDREGVVPILVGALDGPRPSWNIEINQAPLFASKLEVERARVVRSDRELDVLAPITARASGVLDVKFRAAGRTEEFEVEIDADNRRARFRREIPRSQAELGTGILTLTYPGDSDTQPQEVRLRAASGKARLDAERPVIEDGRLKAEGEISSRARGVVRLQLLYEPPGEPTRILEFKADIEDGRYRFDEELSTSVLEGMANRRGVVHSYTLFTGYFERRIRGEMQSYQVLGPRG